MNKAIFLDRDGVVNHERGAYTFRIEDFILNDGLIDFLSLVRKKNYLLLIISNQGGIAKGLYTCKDVEDVHDHFLEMMRKNGIDITDIYYCPHHQDFGKCICRKPDSLLIEKAVAKYDIDRRTSYFFGDRDRDLEAAKKAGIKGIKINSNENLMNYQNIL